MDRDKDFIFLGLLSDGPKHGYQIKKIIKEINSNFINLKTTSIYYPLLKLEKKGYLAKSIGKIGRRPEKYIYHITAKGKEIVGKLLMRNLLILERPFINLDLSLYFMPLFNKSIVQKCLKERIRGLTKIKQWLDKKESSFGYKRLSPNLRIIILHNQELVKTEIGFTEYLLKNIKHWIKFKF